MTVKEFYEFCVTNKIEHYIIKCYGITKYGDVSYSCDLTSKMIHINPESKTITMWDDDDFL
jgi:hypothetical protein